MSMKQISLATTGFELVTKRTRKRVFLDGMNLVVPWTEWVGWIQPVAPSGAGSIGGRPAVPVESMLRIHILQQWFCLSDPAIEALQDVSLCWKFARLDPGMMRLPDEFTILRFRRLLEERNLSIQLLATINATLAKKGLMLKTGAVVDATRRGKLTDNGLRESFSGRLRDECLNVHEFQSLNHAKQVIEDWRHYYNHFRPHGALGKLTPSVYAKIDQVRSPVAARP
jgi:hypothetical protein